MNSAKLILGAVAMTVLCGYHGGCSPQDPAERAKWMHKRVTHEIEDVLDDLEASDAQRDRVLGLSRALMEDWMREIPANEKAKLVLKEEWDSNKPNAERVHRLVDDRFESFRRMAHKLADGALDIHQTLSAEQRRQLEQRWH